MLSSLSLNLALLARRPSRRDGEPRLAIVQVPAGLARLVRVPGATARRSCCSKTSSAPQLPRCCSRARRSSRPRPSAWRATPSWSSTTKAAGRTWSRRRGAAQAAPQRRRAPGSRAAASATTLLGAAARASSRSTAEDVYRVPGAARSARAARADRAARVARDCAIRRCKPVARAGRRDQRADLFAVLDERDVLLHHPYESFDPVVALVDAGGRRSRRARHQADALPHQRRLADRRSAAARRRAGQAGDGARRADGALRRAAQHPAGRARSRKPART